MFYIFFTYILFVLRKCFNFVLLFNQIYDTFVYIITKFNFIHICSNYILDKVSLKCIHRVCYSKNCFGMNKTINIDTF